MSKFFIVLLSAILFNAQVAPPSISDENQVKRLLVIYTPVDGTNIDQNADGSLILSGAHDTVRLWNAETLEEIYNRKHGQVLNGMLFNANGDRFLTWSNEIIHTWDTATGRLLGTLSFDSNVGFRGAMWHGDQIIDWLGGTINLWDGVSPENNHGFLVPGENFNSYPSNAAWNHAQTHFLTWNAAGDTTGDRLLAGRVYPQLLSVPSDEPLAEFGTDFGLGVGKWNADGVRLLVISGAGVQVWIIPPQDRCVVHALSPANLRREPSTDGEPVKVFPSYRLETVINQTMDVDQFTWWQLENLLWVRSDVVEETGRCF